MGDERFNPAPDEEGDVLTETALEELVNDEKDDILTAKDQDLPPIEMYVRNFKVETSWGGLRSKRVPVAYDKNVVDDAIEQLYEELSRWAEHNDYTIKIEYSDIFEEPINEKLKANLAGFIEPESEEQIKFCFFGGVKYESGADTVYPARNIKNLDDRAPKDNVSAVYQGFDGSMFEEYTELLAINEAVLNQYGDVSVQSPENIFQ